MRNVQIQILLLLLVAAVGCKSSPLPSAAYESARLKYDALYEEKLGEAYGDPRMDEIVELLRSVPMNSADTEAAGVLVLQIEEGRSRLALTERPKSIAPTRPASPLPDLWAAWQGSRLSDAGTAATTIPGPGSSASVFFASHAGCLSEDRPFTDGTISGRSFLLAPACDAKFPELKGSYVLVAGDKIVRVVPVSMARVVVRDGGHPGER